MTENFGLEVTSDSEVASLGGEVEGEASHSLHFQQLLLCQSARVLHSKMETGEGERVTARWRQGKERGGQQERGRQEGMEKNKKKTGNEIKSEEE